MLDPGGVLFLSLYPFAVALLIGLIVGEIKQTRSGD